MILSFLRKKFFHKNYISLKGYKKIIKNHDIYLIDEIKKKILNTKLISNKKNLNFFFFIKDINFDFDLIYRQYIYSILVYYGLNRNIICSLNKKKTFFILPDPWLGILRDHNINFNYFKSKLMWFVFALKKFAAAQVYFFKIVLLFLFDKKKVNYDSFYFVDLPKINLTSDSKDENNYLNFFLNELQNDNGLIKNIYHNNNSYNNKITYNFINILKIKNFNKIFLFLDLIKFFLFYLYCSFVALILLPFRQEFSILLKEVFEAFIFHLNKKNYSKIFVFNNSMGIYRPIWTYVKKKQNFKCFFTFDSMFCKPFNHDDDKLKKFNLYFAANYTGYECLNWEKFYFWNKYQKEFYEKRLINKNYEYKILKPINVGGLNYNHKKDKKTKIAFFDIPPFSLNYSLDRHPPLFYTLNNLKNIFEDIVNISKKYNFDIIYKFKRYVPDQHDKKYLYWIENFIKKQPNITFVDNTTSVSSMLSGIDLVIAMPFTAAAVIAKDLNIDCIYYDNSNVEYDGTLAYDEILIIKNKDDLEKWIKQKIQ